MTDGSGVAHGVICLRNISRLFSQYEKPIDEVLDTLVHLLVEGWQYPDEACSKIEYENKEVMSVNYVETPWVQSADIWTFSRKAGRIDVRYVSEKPAADEGPFLKLERDLIETIASELGSYLERKQMERSRELQHRELELYASLLRHDMKNDVGIILGNVDAFRMLTVDVCEIVGELLVSTEAVCERMLSLLNAFGRSSKMAETNIIQLIRKVSEQAQEASMNLTISIDADRGTEDVRVPESVLLPMVFDNLFRNAATYAGEKPNIDVWVGRTDHEVQIVVSDDGPGIAEEVRAILFTRGGSTRLGGGLGLYLSREIVQAMGGSIELAEPEPGKGASFKIVLPMEY